MFFDQFSNILIIKSDLWRPPNFLSKSFNPVGIPAILPSFLKDLSITVITSLHDLNMARSNCDDILLLKDGCALGFGNPNFILSESNISEAFRVKACHELLTPSNTKQITFHLH